MRALKFRAWVNGEMLSPSRTETEMAIRGWIQQESYVLMQCTGLEDKHGREIYEGDIVRETGSMPCEVSWRDEVAGFEFVYVGNSWIPNIDAVGRWFEVLGNIYENQELLL